MPGIKYKIVPGDANQDTKCHITTKAAHITGHCYLLLMCFSLAFAEADEGDCRSEKKCRNLPKAAPWAP